MKYWVLWIYIICISLILYVLLFYYTPDSVDGFKDLMTLNTTQYYCLAAVLKNLIVHDPSLSDPFGMSAITEIGILDPRFTDVFDDKQMLVKDKLAATIQSMTGALRTETSIPPPPYTKPIFVPAYTDLQFS